ncbi:RNA polymerase sigma-70 factor [Mucilaginibacter sp.]|uniref:RNA polymerase sigma-70 factor n=1 Tax=Mucilaginibacter sp. TaxID=1882438 RepID=UPI0025F2161C|nr:RNA polymerase sigma-70 factor [Mucilaginibacter sp.]
MGNYLMHTDEDLVSLLKQDQVGAFETIYARYWDKLFDSAYKRLQNTAICEEIIQDLFVKLWEKRFVLNLTTGLKNYLYTAVKYKVIDHYRKELLQNTFASASKHNPDMDNATEDSIFLNDLKKHLEGIINTLPPKCRNVYELSRLQHKSNKEIAVILNISEKTVEWHLTKALQHIRLAVGDMLVLLVFFLLK